VHAVRTAPTLTAVVPVASIWAVRAAAADVQQSADNATETRSARHKMNFIFDLLFQIIPAFKGRIIRLLKV
jgi:hypothetical protein